MKPTIRQYSPRLAHVHYPREVDQRSSASDRTSVVDANDSDAGSNHLASAPFCDVGCPMRSGHRNRARLWACCPVPTTQQGATVGRLDGG